MAGYDDPNHEGNSSKHHTGKPCIELGCNNPAGTAWGPHWCFECNVKRISRISGQFDNMLRGVGQCRKVYHEETGGYLHGANDDRPYDVDGVTYCGRCHLCMPTMDLNDMPGHRG